MPVLDRILEEEPRELRALGSFPGCPPAEKPHILGLLGLKGLKVLGLEPSDLVWEMLWMLRERVQVLKYQVSTQRHNFDFYNR